MSIAHHRVFTLFSLCCFYFPITQCTPGFMPLDHIIIPIYSHLFRHSLNETGYFSLFLLCQYLHTIVHTSCDTPFILQFLPNVGVTLEGLVRYHLLVSTPISAYQYSFQCNERSHVGLIKDNFAPST